MLIFIPLVIMFFAYSYLYFNSDASYVSYILVYGIILLTIITSFKLYKKFKSDMKQQDTNKLKLEINDYINKIKHEKDDKHIYLYEKKIKNIQKEINDTM